MTSQIIEKTYNFETSLILTTFFGENMSQSDLFLSDYQIFVYLLQKQIEYYRCWNIERGFIDYCTSKTKNEFQNEEKILYVSKVFYSSSKVWYIMSFLKM